MNQQQQHPPRQLEDVLQDPNANWNEIREAMKSSRGCTNAAIMGAIASGQGAAIVPTNSIDDDVSNAEKNTADADEQVVDEQSVHVTFEASASDPTETNEEIHQTTIPLKDCDNDTKEDVTNSLNRRPARRRRLQRRGSHRNSARRLGRSSASMRSQSSGGSNGGSLRLNINESMASINIMDFGVDNNNFNNDDILMQTLRERGGSFDKDVFDSIRRRNSIDEDSYFSDSCGFLDWNHDDESIDLNGLSQSIMSSYSDLVDSSGFLDWGRKGSQASEEPSTAIPPTCNVVSGLSNEIGQRQDSSKRQVSGNRRNPGNRRDSLRSSIVKSFINRNNGEEEWNIEDYENPDDNIECTRRQIFFTNPFQRKSSMDQQPPPVVSTDSGDQEGIQMDDIKQALMKVAKRSSGTEFASSAMCNSAPGSKRTSFSDELTLQRQKSGKDSTTAKDIKPKPQRGSRRATIMGIAPPDFLSGLREEAKKARDEKDNFDSSIDAGWKLPTHNPLISFEKKKARPKRASLDETSSKGNIWNEGNIDSKEDLREAIWINRKDGDVDIDKERRKLYSEDQKNDAPRRDSRPRRPTFMNMEIPDLSLLKRDDVSYD